MPQLPSNDSDPIDVLRRLIRIDSVNPDLVPGAAGETVIAGWCSDWLGEHGFEVHRLEERPGRASIVGIARGTGGGRSLMLNGHLDTVGVSSYNGEPFGGELRDGRIFGRGAFDMKGGVAAIMVAAVGAASKGLSGDVLVTLVADEEFGSGGTAEVLANFTADAAIVTEPSELNLVLAHRGFAWFEINLTGLAAHGSMPHQGVDAIAHASLVMRAIDGLQATYDSIPSHPLLGNGGVRISMISGGSDAATVPSSCTMTIERRTMPGETPDAVEAELRSLLDDLASGTPDFRFELRSLVSRGAFEADPDWPIVKVVTQNAARVFGNAPVTRGEPFWTDAGLILDAGIPCLLIGVDGGGAHADTEWATEESVRQLTAILEGSITDFCA